MNAIAAEVWKAAAKAQLPSEAGVDVLGWEFAFDMNETASKLPPKLAWMPPSRKSLARCWRRKRSSRAMSISSSWARSRWTPKLKKRELTLTLSDFVIPSDDVPAEVRSAIKHWSQMVDYWAVDWDFKDDTFHNQWQSYRTRKNPKLELSVKHEYESRANIRWW